MTAMRLRLRRAVAVVALGFQGAMLTFMPSWQAVASSPQRADFCTVSPASAPAVPEAPATPHHATHACGDCCTAQGGPAPPALALSPPLPPAGAAPLRQRTTPAAPLVAAALPPACGPPAAS